MKHLKKTHSKAYAKGTKWRVYTPISVHAFSDTNWTGNLDNCASTSTYVVFLGANPINWSTKKQNTIAHFSTKAEYRVVTFIAGELNQRQHLLKELSVSLPHIPTIYYDNLGATYLCENPVFHSCINHIVIDYHFVHDQVLKKLLRVSHVPSVNQLVNSLTKPLLCNQFIEHRSKLGVHSGTPTLRGHDKDINTDKYIFICLTTAILSLTFSIIVGTGP